MITECGVCYEKSNHKTKCCKQNLCHDCYQITDRKFCPFCRIKSYDIFDPIEQIKIQKMEYREEILAICGIIGSFIFMGSVIMSTSYTVSLICYSSEQRDLCSFPGITFWIFSIFYLIEIIPFVLLYHVIEYCLGLKYPGECKKMIMFVAEVAFEFTVYILIFLVVGFIMLLTIGPKNSETV